MSSPPELFLAESTLTHGIRILATWAICSLGRFGLQAFLNGTLGPAAPAPRAFRRPLTLIAHALALAQCTLILADYTRDLCAVAQLLNASRVLQALLESALSLYGWVTPKLSSLLSAWTCLVLAYGVNGWKENVFELWREEQALVCDLQGGAQRRYNVFVPGKMQHSRDTGPLLAADWIAQHASGGSGGEGWDFKEALLPLQGMLSLLIYFVGGSLALGCLGIDVFPLLALGGAGGLATAVAANFLLQNTIAGIQLLISRPCSEGERVELRTTYGSIVAGGSVEKIQPLRTVLRGEDGTLLLVPNKVRHCGCVLYGPTRFFSL
jgi:small-conductance mechanosensitive channel